MVKIELTPDQVMRVQKLLDWRIRIDKDMLQRDSSLTFVETDSEIIKRSRQIDEIARNRVAECEAIQTVINKAKV